MFSENIIAQFKRLSKTTPRKLFGLLTNKERRQSTFEADKIRQELASIPLYYLPIDPDSEELTEFRRYLVKHQMYADTLQHFAMPWDRLAVISKDSGEIIILKGFLKEPKKVITSSTLITLEESQTAMTLIRNGFIIKFITTYEGNTIYSRIDVMASFSDDGLCPLEPPYDALRRMGYNDDGITQLVKNICGRFNYSITMLLHVLLLSKPTIIPDYSDVSDNPERPADHGDKYQRVRKYRYITLKVDDKIVRKIKSDKRTWKLKFRSKMPGGTKYYRHERYRFDSNGKERTLKYDHKGRPYFHKSDYGPYERCKCYPERPPLQEKYVAKEVL
jgi:hypothetical protein